MSRWTGAGEWTGDGLRREVFYFPSGGHELYGSLYLPLTRPRPYGIVVCGSWGVEADRTNGMIRDLALGTAKRGITGMIFQYPGQGDSRGLMRDHTIPLLTRAVLDAIAQGSRRRNVEWIFVGLRLGALIAMRAAASGASRRLLLIEPALATLHGAAPPDRAFGYVIPPAIRDDRDPLRGVRPDEGAVIRYEASSPVNPVLSNLEVVERPGTWHFLKHRHPALINAALGWLNRATG
jgi:hypothetical protein